MKIGYALSSEEHQPSDLVRYAARAEAAGFEFALISDHYHPWLDKQGHSSFVWSVLGAIANATESIRIGTGVTCPTVRIHPAIIAQAAATVAAMMPGRFFLGVGTGENLNEHILGDRWPNLSERQAMLEEAVEVIRLLWSGENIDHRGDFYTVEDARVYTLAPEPPEIYVAASGTRSAGLAAAIGDGLICTAPNTEVVEAYREGNPANGPCIAQATVCWASTHKEAVATAFEWWPNAAITGELTVELPLPRHFEQASKMATPKDIAEIIVCGPDPTAHSRKLKEYADAGFDHIYVHQIGPDQEGFIDFYEREILPNADSLAA